MACSKQRAKDPICSIMGSIYKRVLKILNGQSGKFSFSGLVPASKLEASTYLFEAIREAGLDYRDIYVPK